MVNNNFMQERYTLLNYNQDQLTTFTNAQLDPVLAGMENGRYRWLTVNQYDENSHPDVEKILTFFNVDLYLIDSIFDQSQSREYIETDTYLFLRYVIPIFDLSLSEYHHECGSLILTEDAFIVFDQNESELISTVYEKVINGSRARQHGPDFLFYLLLRATVVQSKQFMYVDLNDQLEEAEDEVIDNPGEAFVLDNILELRQRIRPLYDFVYQIRATIKEILEEETRLITPHTHDLIDRYLEKDSQELWEGYLLLREGVESLMDIHRANVAEKTNRIIHILTVVSFIFLPITFISSLYGMNFAYMPELKWRYSYFVVLCVMAIIVLGLIYYMRRKKWI